MRARILEKQTAEAQLLEVRLAEDRKAWDVEDAAEKEERAKRRAAALEEKAKLAAKRAAQQAAEEERVAKLPRTEQPAPSSGPPKCRCSQEAVRLVVKKEGPTCGKAFFKCPRPQDQKPCRFFEWEEVPIQGPEPQAEGAAKAPEASGSKCRCGLEAMRLVVKKEGPNCGKAFLKCARPAAEERCSFFAWEAEAPAGAEAAAPLEAAPAACAPAAEAVPSGLALLRAASASAAVDGILAR